MFYVVANVVSEAAGESQRISVWVSTANREGVDRQLNTLARRERWAHIRMEACEPTGRDDYFPPCSGLDAFEQAEQEGIAWRR